MFLRCAASLILLGISVYAQTDPGPRTSGVTPGGPLQNLTASELAAFNDGKADFEEVDSVSGAAGSGVGLGPRFNLDSCAGCHAFPASGGSSPATNPQIALATKAGAKNSIPSFLTSNGPVREVRFKKDMTTGNADGGVHDVFVISGRNDAQGCSISQPDYDAAAAANNLAFRIPTPLFGDGLIEAIDDATILANKAANASQKSALGIAGQENRNPNDGTLTRFGWKAQNKSIAIFAAEAYNVEQGVTNDLFPNERDSTPGCRFNRTPEDTINVNNGGFSDVVTFTFFARFLAPPQPSQHGNAISDGQQLFSSIGCALCHTPTLMTASSATAALSNQPVNLYSDLLVHHMGDGLADGITQGFAGADQFRSAPLWGLGQRLFFLHDGRTSDLDAAIKAHASSGSEANGVIAKYNALNGGDKQHLLLFLRSL